MALNENGAEVQHTGSYFAVQDHGFGNLSANSKSTLFDFGFLFVRSKALANLSVFSANSTSPNVVNTQGLALDDDAVHPQPIWWGYHQNGTKNSVSENLRRALIDLLVSPRLESAFHNGDFFFDTVGVEKVIYQFVVHAQEIAEEVKNPIRIYKLDAGQDLSRLEFQITTSCTTNGPVRFYNIKAIVQAVGNDDQAKLAEDGKPLVSRFTFEWPYDSRTNNLSVCDGLDWQDVCAILRTEVAFGVDKKGVELSDEDRRVKMEEQPDPLSNYGYIGWVGFHFPDGKCSFDKYINTDSTFGIQ